MNIADLSRVAVEDLVPHRKPMLLLTRVLGLKEGAFEAEVSLEPGSPFMVDGMVPAWVGLEYMAQATAAYAGAEGRAGGNGPKVGMLLGTRDFSARVAGFAQGQRLTVRVKKVIQQENGVSAVEGSIVDQDGADLAQAQLTVIEIEDLGLIARNQGGEA